MKIYCLRKATREDAPAIRKLVLRGGINPTGLDWRRFILAVDHAGRVIGCVQRKPHRDGSVELASLVVGEDWRDQGVGGELVEAVAALHAGDLYLMCRAGLGSFYQRFGFDALPEDRMPAYFQRVHRWMARINRIRPGGEGLLVMVRNCGAAGVDQYPHLVG